MPDPIWLDTNIVSMAIKGDSGIRSQLKAMRTAGRELLVVPAVNSELLNGNVLTMNPRKPVHEQVPSSASRAATKQAMHQLGITVDWESQKVPMSKRIQSLEKPLNNTSVSDALVLSQVKASAEVRGIKKPQIFSAEGAKKAMNSQSLRFGIESIRPTSTKPSPGPSPASPPKIDIADYPPDKEGPVTRFLKDRSVLKKAGLIGASMLASQVSSTALSLIESHFEAAIMNAGKEFQTKFPNTVSLSRNARIDEYRKPYEAALAKLKAPSARKAGLALMAVFAPEKDRAAAFRYVQTLVSKVRLADGAVGSYGEAASDYINAMADLMEQLSKYQTGLPDIADDVKRRASVLQRQGDELMEIFWKVVPLAAAFPVSYYAWLEVQTIATTFQNLASRMGGLAFEISARVSEYDRLEASLDEELIKVSDQLGRYFPDP